jgi:TP901 family phage tail tape measure protein
MAQAAGENATEVSSYLTAIWNNFNTEVTMGQRTLESFGDSLARLGAETAASSAEIADGLEKFAAIGETVGLSFDYASAAVTTIVANTRQSADTVGTALKTIFARLQGLSLGETLEDGVNLNKYSAALEKVGVSVLDLNGNLRNADDIVYDLGMRWNSLTRAQQTALAQTVAGTRQYAQLMSLMGDFEGFLENVERSQNSEGELTK